MTTAAPKMQLPLAPGAPLVYKKVSPSEKVFITSLLPNWQEGQALPANFNELVARGKAQALDAATNPAKIPTPIDPLTPPQKLQTIPLESLDPSQQEIYAKQFAELGASLANIVADAQKTHDQAQQARDLAAASSLNPAIAAAVHHAAAPESDVVLPDPAAPVPEVTPDVAAQPVSEKPLRPWLIIDDADRDQYALAACTGSLFTKHGKLLGGRVGVQFRSLRQDEMDFIDQFVRENRNSRELKQLSDDVVALRAVFLVSELNFSQQGRPSYVAPRSLEVLLAAIAATGAQQPVTGDHVIEWFRNSVCGNHTFWRAVNTAAVRFEMFMDKLEEEAATPDFS